MGKTLLLILFGLSLAAPLQADLEGFREEVETAEDQSAQDDAAGEDTPAPAPSVSPNKSLGEILWEITVYLWLYHNLTTTYSRYPYEKGDFVCWADAENVRGVLQPVTTGDRDFWISGEIQAFHLQGLGTGGWAAVKGHAFRFIGPYLETWHLTDGKELLSGYRAGALFSLIQSDPLSLGLYGQWNHWRGALERTGGTFGLELRSLPFQPLSLQGRAGFQAFPAFRLGEAEIQAGMNLSALEAYLGWRWWNLQTSDGSPVSQYQGAYAGLKMYF